MKTNLRFWPARLGLVGAAWLAATGHGCASEQDEGDYTTPPNFSVQQTRQVALQGYNFVRDEQRQLRTSTYFSRKNARQNAQLDEASTLDVPKQRGRLEAIFHDSYAEGLTVSASTHPGASLRVIPVNAQKVSARLRNDGAVVSFEDAFPNVTAAYGGRDSKLEEFLLIPSERDIPTLAYDLYPGPDFARIEEEEGRLWAYAQDGAGLFTIEPPVADDAAGKRVSGVWKLQSNGSGYRITAEINLKGLAFPVLLDPTFETPNWFRNTTGQPSARAGAAGAFDTSTNCSLIFGGATSTNFDLAQDLNLRCADRAWKTNIQPATKPPKRSYAAMGFHGGVGKAFLFGGYGETSTLNDLWRADITCATPGVTSTCSTAWTQITTTGGPVARYLHGMAWDGNNLLVFGGVSATGQGLRDTWKYDPSTNTWTQLCATCFGESFGLYGFASTTVINGGTRSVYASGGYNNPLGGGSFINTVYRWNGANNWADVSGVDAGIPVSNAGTLNNTELLSPAERYLHWMSPTSGTTFIMGSGVFNDGTTDSYFNDTWLWRDRSGESGNPPDQWTRLAIPSNLANAPGARESATAVYDENRQETVLVGGLTSSTTISNNARVYRSTQRDFTFTQSCTPTANGLNCTGNLVTLAVTFPGLDDSTTPACADMQAQFFRHRTSTGAWQSAIALASASFTGGVCQLSGTTTWNTANFDDFGVRVRDRRFHKTTGGTATECTNSGDQISDTAKSGCFASTSTDGGATCGESVDPSAGTSSLNCANY